MDNTHSPYLSVVVTTRNDDHGGSPLTRLQAFINCFDAQCRRTGLDAEVIIVEWNPPVDRPRLGSLLRWPDPRACTYRFIEVPPELHATLQHAGTLPLFQMIGKNVGIRRALGRFVLATNMDVIFSNELIDYLASRQLAPGNIYRVDRHDILSDFPVDAPLDVQMAYCARHQLRVNARWGTYPVDSNGHSQSYPDDIVDGRTLRLGSGWHLREGGGASGFYRWATDRAEVHVDRRDDPNLGRPAALQAEFESNPYDPSSWVEIEIVEDTGGTLARTRVEGRCVLQFALDPALERCTVELKVTGSPDRQRLALFERRGSMQYLVRSMRLTQCG